MPSIAMFCCKFTNEDALKEKLTTLLDLSIVSDEDIINDVCDKKLSQRAKLEQCLYKKASVFNAYTLEREHNVIHLKSAMAERLGPKKNHLYCGFTSLLIPHDITHVLKVLIIDSKENRVQQAIAEGLTEKNATTIIHSEDQSAYEWTDFLYRKEAFDPSLYDIVIPLEKKSTDQVAAIIKENFYKQVVLETEASIQAIKDFALTAKVESALLDNGQKIETEIHNGHVTLKVNKSTFSFSRLTEKLTNIARAVDGVQGVEVKRGKGYPASIYRDQEFELPPKVLLVDDERDYVLTLSERLLTRNVGPYAVFNGQEALDLIGDDQPDVMVLDLKMPGIDGISVLKETKKNNPNIEVIIVTGHGSEADRKICMELGAFAYLEKPADIDKLSATINKAYKKIADKSEGDDI
jgi:CheY-like chemotaxis protein